MIRLNGYHGTNISNKDNIINEGFKHSKGDTEWLGDGAYFFVEGRTNSSPIGNAVKWAIAEAYHKESSSYRYSEYCVINAEINVEKGNFLDLTESEGMELYNYLRNKYITKIEQAGKFLKGHDFKDGHIINDARENQNIPIHVVRGDFYIKFAVERKLNINFRIPNTTIVSVYNLSTIDLNSLKSVVERKIEVK